ncbi:methylenetetrahydrofolate reductase [Cellulomonas bogoriensis]|uniref:5,10-methylenetetrahydrofolate reductase n=1 Tax=Cellulomonas bogoriensis 69B4 = DSM 16987 TaxID=1386082 RepID=A0A0A0C3V4_9CELL|nr:5,10-methylenetetrahydrofolate reductase [Cellulomonas bogoriensis]KGM14064.1 5,10-methylenetetrahydrofolate reductase [Cellulomonas bogoriensis 69B4 = DSM 16987]
MDLRTHILGRSGELLFFAVTPPRATTPPARIQEIADATAARLQPLEIDGLVLYDIDEESDRNPEERPFPFLPTIDPADYLAQHLRDVPAPVIVYRSVGKYDRPALEAWLRAQDARRTSTVFVGASSRETPVKTTLVDAQAMRAEIRPELLLGGVAIPERHTRNGQEHARLLAKQAAGCSFFVTQVVYDANAAKNLVSDYYYECAARPGVSPAHVVFTLSVCGSVKTMRFLNWLGVDLPRWLENELVHADDTLQASLDHALAIATDLIAYCRGLGIPFGFNVESVSNRRDEIDASVALAADLKTLLRRPEGHDSTR